MESRSICRTIFRIREDFQERLAIALSSPLTGDLESAPVLRSSAENGCLYEFEWHTAAACVLSKTEGDNCTVFDSQAGVCPSSKLLVLCPLELLRFLVFFFNIFYESFRENLL